VRRRLVIAIAAVAGAAVILFAVPLGLVLQRSYRDEDLLRLQRDTIAASRAIDLSAQGGDPVELPRSADALGVYDRSGRRVAGRGPATAPPDVLAALRRARPADDAGGGQLVVAVPLLAGERVTGAVRAARSDAAAARDTHGAWVVLAAIAAGVVAAACLAALLLGRRLAAPLERLAAAARRLGHGDFSVRAPRAGVVEVDAVGAALDATAARLGELIARERAFTTNASHQLRTPLAALRLELEALALRDGDRDEIAAALAQVDRLQATIETLLAVARDDRRPGEVADLARLVDGAEARWRDVLAAEARPLRTRSTAPRPAALASRQVVDEILDVLLDNAHVHGSGAVTVTLRELDGWLALDVADQGSGFADEPEQAMLRLPGADGHGIGLALARELAHAEGGRLIVSRTGPGPVFTLLLRHAVQDSVRSVVARWPDRHGSFRERA
jgi:signal transduction histidine kinase